MAEISTKPYMIRAIYEWCCDSGHTPYLLVKVGGGAQVPVQHVHNDEIVLNVSPMATNALQMGNDFIQFEARFNGVPEHIVVPVGNVAAIYARETGSGMAFSPEVDEEAGDDGAGSANVAGEGGEVIDFGGGPGRSSNRRGLKSVPASPAVPEEPAPVKPGGQTDVTAAASADAAAADAGAEGSGGRPVGRAGGGHAGTGHAASGATGEAPAADARPDSPDAPSGTPAEPDSPDGDRPPPAGGRPRLVRVK